MQAKIRRKTMAPRHFSVCCSNIRRCIMRRIERQYDFGAPKGGGLNCGDPIMASEELTELGLDDFFAFSCYPGISCFNACCRDLNQFLMPYDIIRLKQDVGITSTRFLAH